MIELFLYAALIVGPVVLALFCFVGLPAMYVVLGKRAVDRLGFDRAGNLFMGLTAALVAAAWLSPPRVVTRVATPVGDLAAAMSARVRGGVQEVFVVDTQIDWAQTMAMLVLDPPVLLWLVALGGLAVLAVMSRESA